MLIIIISGILTIVIVLGYIAYTLYDLFNFTMNKYKIYTIVNFTFAVFGCLSFLALYGYLFYKAMNYESEIINRSGSQLVPRERRAPLSRLRNRRPQLEKPKNPIDERENFSSLGRELMNLEKFVYNKQEHGHNISEYLKNIRELLDKGRLRQTIPYLQQIKEIFEEEMEFRETFKANAELNREYIEGLKELGFRMAGERGTDYFDLGMAIIDLSNSFLRNLSIILTSFDKLISVIERS